MKKVIFICLVTPIFVLAQENTLSKSEKRMQEKATRKSEQFTYEGNELFRAKKPANAETRYRHAISQNKNNTAALYNLGDLLYEQKSYTEAGYFFKEASMTKNAPKEEKHKAFHNMGNVFMKEKQYEKAVMAYKEALRYNPTDDETRYNLAVAKEFLKNILPENQQNNNDQNNQNNNQQDKENQQDKNDKNKNEQQNKDKNQDKENKNNNQDKENPNQNGENKNEQNQDKRNESEQGNQPQKGQLSPQQAERILEAMNNEERKTQEKINAQKVKGRPARSEKDW